MTSRRRDDLGRYGIWRGHDDVSPDFAVLLERLGFGTLWLGTSPPGDLRDVDPLLAATSTLRVATGIVNIWAGDPKDTAAAYARVDREHPGRFVLGVGTGHREATQEYAKPYEAITQYVDVLLGEGVPAEAIVLAALGPRVMRLAAERTAGAHPYLVTPEHTARARDILGPERLLAPEQKVVLDADPARARTLARKRLAQYLQLRNYTDSFRRLGFTDADLEPPGSDALVDALVVHGDDSAVAAGVRRHLDAGADHVAVQLLLGPGAEVEAGFEHLANALGLSGDALEK